jgi:hypothetical protein
MMEDLVPRVRPASVSVDLAAGTSQTDPPVPPTLGLGAFNSRCAHKLQDVGGFPGGRSSPNSV